MTTAYTTIKHTFQVGEDVSYGFNGDWYHDGTIVKITKNYITTSGGRKYSLKVIKDRVWIDDDFRNVDREVFSSVGGGTWALCKGICNKQNPHF